MSREESVQSPQIAQATHQSADKKETDEDEY
jgi:hypothetical protein